MTHRICLVGYGAIAGYHADAITRVAGGELGWVVGPRDEPRAEFARQWAAGAHTADLDLALADPTVDVVVIGSPTDLHADQAGRALRAGKHVLVEIPIATNYAEYSALTADAARRDLRFAVCHTFRYYPELRYVRQLVEAGDLHIQHIVFRHTMFRRENVGWTGYQRSWTDNLLWHHGCHVVDACLWLLGAPEVEVTGHAARPGGPLTTRMDFGVTLRTPADQLATIAMSYNNHLRHNDCAIIGEEASYQITFGRERTLVGPEGPIRQTASERDILYGAIGQQDADFLAAVDAGAEPHVSAARVEPTMRTLQAIEDAFTVRA